MEDWGLWNIKLDGFLSWNWLLVEANKEIIWSARILLSSYAFLNFTRIFRTKRKVVPKKEGWIKSFSFLLKGKCKLKVMNYLFVKQQITLVNPGIVFYYLEEQSKK